MATNTEISEFFANFSALVVAKASELRAIILENLPNIQEILDIKAKLIAYCYGPKYADMICVIIPSKKGLKLGFYKGVQMTDPYQILKGDGKFSRYIEIDLKNRLNIEHIIFMLQESLKLYGKKQIKNIDQ